MDATIKKVLVIDAGKYIGGVSVNKRFCQDTLGEIGDGYIFQTGGPRLWTVLAEEAKCTPDFVTMLMDSENHPDAPDYVILDV